MTFAKDSNPLADYIDLLHRSSEEFKDNLRQIREGYFEMLKTGNLEQAFDKFYKKFLIPFKKEADKRVLMLVHTNEVEPDPVAVYDYRNTENLMPLSIPVDQPAVFIKISGPIGEEQWRKIWETMTKRKANPIPKVRNTGRLIDFGSPRKPRLQPDIDFKLELYRLKKNGMTLPEIVDYVAEKQRSKDLKYKPGILYTDDDIRKKINEIEAWIQAIQ